MKSNRLSLILMVGLLMGVASALSACGSGGGGEGETGASDDSAALPPHDQPGDGVDPGIRPVPEPPPEGGGATGAGTPPEPPGEGTPPTPPPGEGATPAGPAIPWPYPTHAGFGGVHAVVVDPETHAVYGVRAEDGRVLALAQDADEVEDLGSLQVVGIHALAFHPAERMLLAIRDGGSDADDELHTVDLANRSTQLVGVITGYQSICAAAFGPGTGVLYAVDAATGKLLTIDTASGLATPVAQLEPEVAQIGCLAGGLTPESLLGVSAETGATYSISVTDGTATRRGILLEGPMDALAAGAPDGRYYAVRANTGTLREIDPQGAWIGWDEMRGLSAGADARTLHGTHARFGLVVRLDAVSGWRQVLARIAIGGLEGLAYDAASQRLYTVSAATKTLYAIDAANGTPETIGVVTGGGTWQQLAGLAFHAGRLFAVDRPSGALLEVNATDATASRLTQVHGHTGLESLTYDAERGKLLAAANDGYVLLAIPATPNGNAEVLDTPVPGPIGGLAWTAEGPHLLGTDLAAGRLATLEAPPPPPETIGDVRALAFAYAQSDLRGFNVQSGAYLRFEQGAAAELGSVEGLRFEAMASDPATGRMYLADLATHSLYEANEHGRFTRIGDAGALGSADVVAMAFDAGVDPGVLRGFDVVARRFVTIDTESGVATPHGDAVELQIRAMTYDLDSTAILAVASQSGLLFEVDRDTYDLAEVGPIPVPNVQAMAALPGGLEELILVDADAQVLVRVDRYTGELLPPYEPLAVHRGGGSRQVALLLWPRGDVRAEALATVGLEVDPGYEGGLLVFKRGSAVLAKATFEPDQAFSVVPIPAAVREALKVGDEVTWGVQPEGRTKPVMTSFKVVARPEAAAELKRLAEHPYLSKRSATIRGTRAARVLAKHGLRSEAFLRALEARALEKDSKSAERALEASIRGLLPRNLRQWSSAWAIGALAAAEKQKAGSIRRYLYSGSLEDSK